MLLSQIPSMKSSITPLANRFCTSVSWGAPLPLLLVLVSVGAASEVAPPLGVARNKASRCRCAVHERRERSRSAGGAVGSVERYSFESSTSGWGTAMNPPPMLLPRLAR